MARTRGQRGASGASGQPGQAGPPGEPRPSKPAGKPSGSGQPGRLSDLGALRQALAARAQAEAGRLREKAEREAREREEAARLERERTVFRREMADAIPLAGTGRIDPVLQLPEPIARQFIRDEREALAESLSDEIDVERLLDTDETLSYRREGIGLDVVRKLRRGHWVIQDRIDLHGLRVDEAREALGAFVALCVKREIRCVRVIHGKGLGSPSREPVLKGKVLKWLAQRHEVLAFCQAGPNDGGSGALLVLLRAARR